MDANATIRALRQALAASPDNVPLRQHLADTLFAFGHHADAEQELLALLKLAPDDAAAMLLLARCYRAQGKGSAAAVVLERLAARGDARGAVELAKLLAAEGDVDAALRGYRRAVAADPTVRDAEFEQRFGIVGADADRDAGAAEVVDGRVRAAGASAPDGVDELRPVRSDVKFAHVGGMAELKQEIRKKIVLPLQRADLYQAYGKKVGGGILMYGPPGCGKTFLARATAGEIDATFLSVGIHDVLEMWLGQSERNLHGVFATARRHAPCVLFFDEVDALGASRGDMKHSAGRQTINQFLAELDGLGSDNDGLLVLAATNAPWHMDSAFRRPGRFDRVIFVPPPDLEARGDILRLLLAGKPQDDVDFAAVAKRTERFSGADLKALVDRAIEARLDDAVRRGLPEPLRTRDLLAAAKLQKPTTSEWFAAAKNYVLYANDAGLYDDLKEYLRL
ncbi:MAG: tetratricopeptide repeat protein [Planctomycetes bacterium]|nr:tetratricopeptide repeat protein [Planctomycetota bacterium]